MKKVIVLTAILLLSISTPCWANIDSLWMTLGTENFSKSIGLSFSPHFGLEIGNAKTYNSNLNITNLSATETQRDYKIDNKNSFGIDLLWYPSIKHKYYFGIGIYYKEKENLTYSRIYENEIFKNQINYQDNSYNDWVTPLSIGYQYNVKRFENFILGIGYHTERGFNIHMGSSF